MRVAPTIVVSEADRRQLEKYARGRSTPARRVQRAQIVLRAAAGEQNQAIAVALRTTWRAVGLSEATVRRIWQAHGLKPHQTRPFKLSRDPRFAEKLDDVIGLYLAPPEHAIVLSLDEKSQIQALDRTQPGLRLILEKVKRPGHPS